MADAPNTLTTLNGLFKTVYADKLLDLVPDFAVLQKRVSFASDDKQLGAFYAQPVNLAQECGFTYNGTAGTVVTLSDAVAGVMKEAQVYGSELILRAQLSYKALSQSAKGGPGSPKAFKKATAWKVEDMNNSMRKRLEIAMIYGQSAGGVGIVGSIAATDLVTLSDATWAGGIWAGAEGAYVDVLVTGLATARLLNARISAINSDTKVLTIVGATGASVAATDVIFFKGAITAGGTPTYNEMAGLQKIIGNTGTLFAIDAASYSLWKGTSDTSFGQPSFAKFQTSIAKAVNKGLMEKVLLLVSPKCFGVMNSDQAALRVFDSSYKSGKGDQGFESLQFHSTNGAVEIVSHPMVKDGDAFILPEESLMRIGSVDVSFGLNGMEDFIQWVPTKNAYEIQCMADQAIFLERPAHAIYVSGITYA